MSERPKRPRDPNQLAKLIVDIASGEASDDQPKAANRAGAELGRKGGRARADRMSPERRKEIARKAAQLRWAAKSD